MPSPIDDRKAVWTETASWNIGKFKVCDYVTNRTQMYQCTFQSAFKMLKIQKTYCYNSHVGELRTDLQKQSH